MTVYEVYSHPVNYVREGKSEFLKLDSNRISSGAETDYADFSAPYELQQQQC